MTKSKSKTGKGLPNAPSSTGNRSGKKRGNNPPKTTKKSTQR